MDGLSSIKAPKGPAGMISATQIISGPPILPVARIKLYSDAEWEEFTNEWAHASLKKNYHDVIRFGSSGDRGVDIPSSSTRTGSWARGTVFSASTM